MEQNEANQCVAEANSTHDANSKEEGVADVEEIKFWHQQSSPHAKSREKMTSAIVIKLTMITDACNVEDYS